MGKSKNRNKRLRQKAQRSAEKKENGTNDRSSQKYIQRLSDKQWTDECHRDTRQFLRSQYECESAFVPAQNLAAYANREYQGVPAQLRSPDLRSPAHGNFHHFLPSQEEISRMSEEAQMMMALRLSEQEPQPLRLPADDESSSYRTGDSSHSSDCSQKIADLQAENTILRTMLSKSDDGQNPLAESGFSSSLASRSYASTEELESLATLSVSDRKTSPYSSNCLSPVIQHFRAPPSRFEQEMNRLEENLSPSGIIEARPGAEPNIVLVLLYGPDDTPYEGGVFDVKFTLPPEYPHKPPIVFFQTKVWHPNVSHDTGEVCDFTDRWQSDSTLVDICTMILAFLIKHDKARVIDLEVGSARTMNPKKCAKTARKWTQRYAQPRAKPTAASGKKQSGDKSPVKLSRSKVAPTSGPMANLSRSRRKKVLRFCDVTGAFQESAVKLLKAHGWDVPVAVDKYLDDPFADCNVPDRSSKPNKATTSISKDTKTNSVKEAKICSTKVGEIATVIPGPESKFRDTGSKVPEASHIISGTDTESAGSGLRIQESDTRIQELDSRIQELDSRIQEADSRLQESDTRIQESDSTLQESVSESQSLDHKSPGAKTTDQSQDLEMEQVSPQRLQPLSRRSEGVYPTLSRPRDSSPDRNAESFQNFSDESDLSDSEPETPRPVRKKSESDDWIMEPLGNSSWVSMHNIVTDKWYYNDRQTGASQWGYPFQTPLQLGDSGWCVVGCPNTQRPYYFNKLEKKTQWERPVIEPNDVEPSPSPSRTPPDFLTQSNSAARNIGSNSTRSSDSESSQTSSGDVLSIPTKSSKSSASSCEISADLLEIQSAFQPSERAKSSFESDEKHMSPSSINSQSETSPNPVSGQNHRDLVGNDSLSSSVPVSRAKSTFESDEKQISPSLISSQSEKSSNPTTVQRHRDLVRNDSISSSIPVSRAKSSFQSDEKQISPSLISSQSEKSSNPTTVQRHRDLVRNDSISSSIPVSRAKSSFESDEKQISPSLISSQSENSQNPIISGQNHRNLVGNDSLSESIPVSRPQSTFESDGKQISPSSINSQYENSQNHLSGQNQRDLGGNDSLSSTVSVSSSQRKNSVISMSSTITNLSDSSYISSKSRSKSDCDVASSSSQPPPDNLSPFLETLSRSNSTGSLHDSSDSWNSQFCQCDTPPDVNDNNITNSTDNVSHPKQIPVKPQFNFFGHSSVPPEKPSSGNESFSFSQSFLDKWNNSSGEVKENPENTPLKQGETVKNSDKKLPNDSSENQENKCRFSSGSVEALPAEVPVSSPQQKTRKSESDTNQLSSSAKCTDMQVVESEILRFCDFCGEKEKRANQFQNCVCKTAFYCRKKCQKLHWHRHQNSCNYFQKSRRKTNSARNNSRTRRDPGRAILDALSSTNRTLPVPSDDVSTRSHHNEFQISQLRETVIDAYQQMYSDSDIPSPKRKKSRKSTKKQKPRITTGAPAHDSNPNPGSPFRIEDSKNATSMPRSDDDDVIEHSGDECNV
eukprot:50195_1